MKRLGKTSGKPFSAQEAFDSEVEGMLTAKKSAQEVAEEELYDLIESDPELSEILSAYRADRDTLEHIYRQLLFCGAGQWVQGEYVPASALATPPTLDFILRAQANPQFDQEDDWLFISSKLIEYFESGSVGPLR